MMRVLLTGSSGFIGSHLLDVLQRDDRYEVKGLDACPRVAPPTDLCSYRPTLRGPPN